MRNWTIETTETQNIAVLLFPRFSNHCLANAVEPLRAANDLLMREVYRWRFVTLDGAGVSSSSGLPVVPNSSLRDHPGGDFLFVMSSYDMRRFATPQTARALLAAAQRFPTIAGMDTGAWLMAHAGLLESRAATIHWDEFTAFSETFDDVRTSPERVVTDGPRITCGGAMTTFDLVLELIGRTHGEALCLEIASLFLHHAAKPPADRLYMGRVSAMVRDSIALMSDALETPLAIPEIAARAGTNQRGLTRAFQKDLGAPPQKVYSHLRLALARRQAEHSNYPVQEIALRCGYRNAAAMTRAFVARYGRPPSAFRQRD